MMKFILDLQTVYQQFWKQNAEVAQLVERQPSKPNVASSTLVFRSKEITTKRGL